MRIVNAIRNLFSPRAQSGNRDPLSNFWYTNTPTADSALSISTVFACIYVRSNTVGALPWHVYRDSDTRAKDKARDHEWYETLHDRPNVWQTPIEFRSMAMAHIDMRGNFYARVDPPGVFRSTPQLVPLHPDRMKVSQAPSGRLEYQYTYKEGNAQKYSQDDIYHVKGLTLDGIRGITAFEYARETTTLAVSQQAHATKVFQKSGIPKYYLSMEKHLSQEARDNFRKEWKGLAQEGEVPILEDDMKLNAVGMTLEDAQWIESRKWTGREFCQFLRTPPHLVFLDEDSKANMEQKGLEWLTIHLNPELVRFEQAIQPWIGDGYFSQFNRDAIVRSSLKDRYEAHAVATGGRAFKTVDEVRDAEDMKPLGGEAAELPPPPNQSIPAKQAGQKFNNRAEPQTDDEEDQATAINLQPLIDDAANRIVAAEIKGLTRRADKASEDREKFDVWLLTFYSKHAEYMEKTLSPLEAVTGQCVDIDAICGKHIEELRCDDVPKLLAEWQAEKPSRLSEIIGAAICPKNNNTAA